MTNLKKTRLSVEELIYSSSQYGFFPYIKKEGNDQSYCLLVKGGSLSDASLIYNGFINGLFNNLIPNQFSSNEEDLFKVFPMYILDEKNREDLIKKIESREKFLFVYAPNGLKGSKIEKKLLKMNNEETDGGLYFINMEYIQLVSSLIKRF